jgi:hypothetical protein
MRSFHFLFTSSMAMVVPRPVPPKRRDVDASAWENGRNNLACATAFYADAGIRDGQFHITIKPETRSAYLASFR